MVLVKGSERQGEEKISHDKDSEGFRKGLACNLGLYGEKGNVKRAG